MANKPVIFLLDDDPEVLNAIQRDIRREFGKDYRVMRASAGSEALEALAQLKLRDDVVAFFLIDQRMPEMTGVEFLTEAMKFFPDARRALLTAYADTNAAIQAINAINLDYYLLKPWDPPEENLFPVVHDLLDGWQRNYRPEFEGVRIIGNRWSPQSHALKDFLARNRVPYRWLDVETDQAARDLLKLIDGAKLPIALFPDGTQLVQPTTVELAGRVGLQTVASQPSYDLAIVGGGPGGLAAAVYGASEGLKTILIEREATGGQAGQSSRIENYLGFPVGLSGNDLAHRAVAQATRFGVEILTPAEVCGVRIEDRYRIIQLTNGAEIITKAVLIATGVSYRRLQVAGCDELTGAGIYYGAAMTEAPSVMGQNVFIVGAGNSAGQAAMYFSRYASTVHLVVRGDDLGKSMSQYLIDQITDTPNIAVRLRTEIFAVHGEAHLEAVTLIERPSDEMTKYDAAGLFVFIGAMPLTDWLAGVVERDQRGFLLTGSDLIRDGLPPKSWKLARPPFLLETSVPGIFAAGDVRYGSVKRVASAVGEGSIAVQFIHQYLGDL
ncbi:MAG: FAD-dependent oxidoreductase [Chloroflexota bacterium]|nr:FAD-dependent oxidoreductase [Chloroflexota bacterium]